MFLLKRFSMAVLLASASSQPLFAQALATEVLEEYFADATASGMTVVPGAKTVTGTTVEWKDIVVTFPNDGGSYALAFIRAEELGGDKVSLTYPEEIAIMIDPKGQKPLMDITIRTSGVSHIVSGSKSARNHDMTLNAMNIAMSSGEPAFSLNLDMSDVVSTQLNTGDTLRNYQGTFNAAELKMSYAMDDGQTKTSSSGAYANLAATFDVDGVSQDNIGLLLSGDRNMEMRYTMSGGSVTTDITSPQMSAVIDTTAGSASGAFSIKDGVFTMSGAIFCRN
jgi:hypothetical protein